MTVRVMYLRYQILNHCTDTNSARKIPHTSHGPLNPHLFCQVGIAHRLGAGQACIAYMPMSTHVCSPYHVIVLASLLARYALVRGTRVLCCGWMSITKYICNCTRYVFKVRWPSTAFFYKSSGMIVILYISLGGNLYFYSKSHLLDCAQ